MNEKEALENTIAGQMQKLREVFTDLLDQAGPQIESVAKWFCWIMFKVRCLECDNLLTRDEVENLGFTCCDCEIKDLLKPEGDE